MAGSKWHDQSGMVPVESEADNIPVERETGIVEKLLNTYGFIRCCDRQARLFFHYSQYSGNLDHLKPGDAVDFEMTFDKKSGKPIAISVTKIPSDIARGAGQTLINGVITSELNAEGKGGRVAYDNCGECFFFEFSRKDLCDPTQEGPCNGQDVEFLVIQSATGRLQATEVRPVAAPPQQQQQQQQQQPQQSRKTQPQQQQQPHFITTPLVYPSMVMPIMPGLPAPQVIAAYNQGPTLQVAHVVNGSQSVGANGRMLQPALNGNSAAAAKDVEALAGHSQAQHAGYKVNPNNSLIVQQSTTIQHFSGQTTKQINPAQQPGHQAAGSLNYIGAPPTTTSGPTQSKGQVKNSRNSNRLGDDIEEQENHNQRYQGVVCTFKDTYGFVERADVVKEIFFHCSEGYEGLALGDDVSFDIATRNNRTVAVNLQRLPSGTVIFNDLEDNVRKGTITKLYNQTEEPLNGRVVCEENGEKIQFGFGDRDLFPSLWTMKVGDPVTFQVATDRRDEAKQATNIAFAISAPGAFAKETRLTGTVATLKENYGFITTEQDNTKYYFRLNEVLEQELRIDNVVQFSLGSEFQHGNQNGSSINNRQVAIRISKTPGQSKKKSSRKSTAKCTHRGFVSALKDHFGFIESENHSEDLFFHFTCVDGDYKDLQVGSEVEYGLVKKDRPSAEVVRLLEKGSIPDLELVSDEVTPGKVVRSLRCHNPDQAPYTGLIEITNAADESKEAEDSAGNDEDETNANNETEKEYEFSVMSLAKQGEVLQRNDLVEFQLATCKTSGKVFAVNVKSIRKVATIESMKGQLAFLNYDLEGGRKLSFNTSDVSEKPKSDFSAGDVVEFDLARGRNNKLVATNVKRIREKEASPRPAALINRIKSMAISEEGPRVVAIRQPKGPDGTRGFFLAEVAA